MQICSQIHIPNLVCTLTHDPLGIGPIERATQRSIFRGLVAALRFLASFKASTSGGSAPARVCRSGGAAEPDYLARRRGVE
jgi:hypothetical protein